MNNCKDCKYNYSPSWGPSCSACKKEYPNGCDFFTVKKFSRIIENPTGHGDICYSDADCEL
jgi:hypothetical protein